MATTTTDDKEEQAFRARWATLGLEPNVQDDLVGLAHELAALTEQTYGSALATVDEEAKATMVRLVVSRVRDTIIYGTDLDKRTS